MRTPDLVADVRLYATSEGGKARPVRSGYGCPCFVEPDLGVGGWDARMQLADEPFKPGTERRVGFVFLTEDGAETMKQAGRFFLWGGRFAGEATVVR
jgi:hypothetical protein